MSKPLYYSRIIVGLALAATSTAAIVLAMVGLAVSPVIWWFTLTAGVAFQFALYLLALGASGDRWLSRVYLAVSVAATVAFFEYAWQHQAVNSATLQQTATSETFATQQLQQQVIDATAQIATLQQTAQADSLNWRRLETIATLQSLEARRETLLQRYTAMQQQNVNVTAAPSGSIEAALREAPAPFRIAIFVLLACLLDLGAIRLLRTKRPALQITETLACNVAERCRTLQNVADEPVTDVATQVAPIATPATLNETSDVIETPEHETLQKNETQPCNVTQRYRNVIDMPCNVAEDIARIAETIKSGKYGHQPVVRKIIENEGVRHPVVKKALDLLIRQGAAEKRGNRFVLIAA